MWAVWRGGDMHHNAKGQGKGGCWECSTVDGVSSCSVECRQTQQDAARGKVDARRRSAKQKDKGYHAQTQAQRQSGR
jgi:hypothetical protein